MFGLGYFGFSFHRGEREVSILEMLRYYTREKGKHIPMAINQIRFRTVTPAQKYSEHLHVLI
jgi:hypothetical protein